MSQSEIDLRRRIADLSDRLDAGASNATEGTPSMLVQTRAETTYPTTANVYYACAPIYVDGPETEGAAASFTPDPVRIVYAYNLGTQIPPVTTRLIVSDCGGRWVFRYDG